jgi:hypothetical protein
VGEAKVGIGILPQYAYNDYQYQSRYVSKLREEVGKGIHTNREGS